MSQYSWSKRYQIPEVCFKTEKNSQKSRGFDKKLRETIDIGSLRYEDQDMRQQKTKPLAAQALRHTMHSGLTLTSLLGQGYKYFEPRTNKPKIQPSKNTRFNNYHENIARSIKSYDSQSNKIWSELKFNSPKEFKQFEKEPLNKRLENRDYHLNSLKLIIPSKSLNENIRTPQKSKQQQLESPYTFLKKNKLLYTTPQTNKYQESDEISTKFGSPTSSSQSTLKFLTLKQVKKQSIKPPQLQDFVIVKHLGEGRFGSVSMAIHKKSGFLVALKRVKKSVIKAHKIQNQFLIQIKMQLFLKHPNILKLYGYFDDEANIYLILQFMEQGTLFNKLKSLKEKHFQEKIASQKIEDILYALKYMHDMEIAHRDIKPQNIVLSNGVCKLCDFGWATRCQNRRRTLCGTIDYVPPQVLQGKQYGITMDLWCLGVLSYELLVGKTPFYNISRKQTIQKIIKADRNELKLPEHLSKLAINFIQNMLIKDPQERMQAKDAIQHQFIVKYAETDNQKLRSRYR